MTLRVITYRLGVIPLLLLLCILAACSQQDLDQEEQGMVNLKVLASPGTKAGEGGTATATLPAKETDIFDLSIFIFNSNGDVIGFTSQDFSDGKPTAVVVKTRKATGCSVYAVANAKTLNKDTSPFAGVSTLSEFQQKYITFKDMASLESAPCLLMVGYLKGFDTTSSASRISLQRLASRLDFTITVKDDKDTGLPIVVDSYQLCHAPLSAFYAPADMSAITLPQGAEYVDYTLQNTNTKANPYTAYVYANPASTAQDATYLLIKAHSQTSPTDTRKIWQSDFKVYLNGITGLADYKLLPNYHYSVNITVQGSSQAQNGVIASYTAYPYMAGGSIASWTPEKIPTDM